jgi:hypothetical protein
MHSAQALRKLQSVVSPMPRQGSTVLRRGVKTQALEMVALAAVAGTGALAALALSWIDVKRKTGIPELFMAETPFNKAVINSCPTLTSTYHPSLFLTNGHVETIVAAKSRSKPPVDYQRECLLRPDGGCVSLDWEHLDAQHHALPDDAPVLILLPGLTGGSGDSYVRHAVLQARESGIRAVVFNSRGTADSPVTSTQFYSASFTGDMRCAGGRAAQMLQIIFEWDGSARTIHHENHCPPCRQGRDSCRALAEASIMCLASQHLLSCQTAAVAHRLQHSCSDRSCCSSCTR